MWPGKRLFPCDLHAAAKCVEPMEGLLQATCHTESKTCKREKITSAHLEMLHTISLPAGPLHTRNKVSFPGTLGCVPRVSPPKSQATLSTKKSSLPVCYAEHELH